MIDLEEALKRLLAHAPRMRTETCQVESALGRHLAEDIVAKVTRPPMAVSAMDGYAVKLTDVAAKRARLKIIGAVPAGQPLPDTVKTGQCVRIFTGGALPNGTDHIVPQENTELIGDQVIINEAATEARFVRAAGRDFYKSDILVRAGTRLLPAHLAIAAAANLATASVYAQPKVALLASGDELRAPGSPLEPGQIVNSNPHGLAAMISLWGGLPHDLGIAKDTIVSIHECVADADDADIIVPIGGASVGDHDHMRAAFAQLGFEPVFEKIAVKPGKPTWFSKNANQCVLGLPGNPASAFVCAHLFLKPLIDQATPAETMIAKLEKGLPANGDRVSYLRAKYSFTDTGQLAVMPADDQDSSLLTPFITANCLIKRDKAAPSLTAGELVSVLTIS